MTTNPASNGATENLLQQLAKQCVWDSKRWFPSVAPMQGEPVQISDLVHHALSLAGEVGEVANIIKKIDRGDLSLSNELVKFDLSDEITDVFIYLLNLAGMLEIDLLKTYFRKRKFNEERFGPQGVKK